jgi:serine kinase of HPr protein (carbohydrate metabolism regulator)
MTENIHATGLVLDGLGLILRGPPGAGKSLLALELLARWEDRGRPARLVADDRIDLEATPGGLVMHAPRAIAGLIELRGRGIVRRPYVATAPLHLVVDLVTGPERMPAAAEFVTELSGIVVPRCPVPRAGDVERSHQVLLIREALQSLSDGAGA